MSKKQYVLLLAVSLVAGLVGGAVSSWFLMGVPVSVQQTPQQGKVIQARQFEVVDAQGNVRAGFGMGVPGNPDPPKSQFPSLYMLHWGSNQPSFSLGPRGWDFVDEEGRDLVGVSVSPPGYSNLYIKDQGLYYGQKGPGNTKSNLVLGSEHGHPSVKLNDNNTHIELTTGERGEGKLDMTAEGNEVELNVMPKSDPAGAATLNLTVRDSSGQREHEVSLAAYDGAMGFREYLLMSSGAYADWGKLDAENKDDLKNFQKKLHERAEIALGIDADGPSVALKDNNGKLRAVLGNIDIVSPSTGSVEKRPASSLVLFDKKEHLTWQTP